MLCRTLLLIAVVLSVSLTVLAQSQANTGNIEGRVTDPNGASVTNVTVTATNLATGLVKNAQTNDEGVYRIVFLPPGA
ncbi:MAG TPA: carboxypeptidase-like regulatory domain-containing protein, partial [Pyrinomonadaceae bacterium]|nr:carboxypeptidase-like regulatory domain-containing protein [Pyrinomonadaceae bacterium]